MNKSYHSFNDMLPDIINSKKDNDGWSIDVTVNLLEVNGYKKLRDGLGSDKVHSIACYSDNEYLVLVAHEKQKITRYAEYVEILSYFPIKKPSSSYFSGGSENA